MTENKVYVDHRRPSLCTRTGVEFSPLDPKPEDVRIEDISWALGMKCRYTGHTRTFYSVAEHSVLVARYCELRWPKQPDLYCEALMHDATEAYLPDLTGPVKRDPRVGDWFNPIEDGVAAVIADVFGITYPTSDEVKYADKEILKREIPELMPRTGWWKITEPDAHAATIEIAGWAYPIAQLRFMQAFRRYFVQ